MKRNKDKNKNQLDGYDATPRVDIFERPWIHYVMISTIILFISITYFKMAFLNYAPKAHDTLQWRYSSQQIIEFNQENDEIALWTDNMFAGMPSYMITFPARFPSIRRLFNHFNNVFDWRVRDLIIGAIGMYLLIVYLKFSPLIALFAGLSFALSPHFIALIEIGHNTKFITIMLIPWIFLAFEDLRRKRRLLSIGLLSIFLIEQLRVNHFQITYYTILMMIIYWIVYLIRSIKDKDLKNYAIFTGLTLISFIIAALAVADPYLSSYEYSYYTIRGGGRLSTEYATSWSWGIGEVFSFIIPHFYGGISPHYWGPMPFTQVFHYMGIVVFYLGIIAGIYYFKKTKIKALLIICVIALLISYGKHLPFLSNFLLSYMPFFNKFRVPAMILCIIQFCFPILAAYGLKLFMDKRNEKDHKFNRSVLISFFASLGIFSVFMFGNINLIGVLDFIRPNEIERFTVPQVQHIQNVRMELFNQSAKLAFGLLSGGILLLWLLSKSFINKYIILFLLVGLTTTDLMLINRNHFKEGTLVQQSTILDEFPTTATDLFLLEDEDLFRIYPFHDFANARWSYYHQSIGGYHGAKLERYQDILDRNLYAELSVGIPINWNIINMLNVKYLIFNSRVNIPNPDIEFVFFDRETQNAVFRNNAMLPRAWFVENHEIIRDRNRLALRLNDPEFNPRTTVIVEEEIPNFYFDEEFTIEMIDRGIHHAKWKTSNDRDAFMVISEIYYPAGWYVYVNGVRTTIYASNHILRGIIVPAGENTIEMVLKPAIYRISLILSAIGLLTAILVTIIGVVVYFRQNYGKGIVYKINM